MWDIKIDDWVVELLDRAYYLNHVGYKAFYATGELPDWCLYYLNHVGYKASEASFSVKPWKCII